MRCTPFILAFVLSMGVAYAAAGQADAEAALKAQGYTTWKSIVLDNGTWEVDDAINAEGKQFDLRMDAKTLKTTQTIPE